MTFRRRAVARRSGSRRETSWIGIGANTASVDSTAVLMSSLNAAALALRPFTIVRTYLEVLLRNDDLAADETVIAAIGMAVVSDQATAVGVTAVSTPTNDIGSDLFYLHQGMMNRVGGITDVGNFLPGKHYSIESKAMRKVNNDSDIILVVEGDASQSGGVISVMGRFLIKEH